MNVQYLTDSRGQRTGVFIPIKDWEEMKKNYHLPEADDDHEPTKEEILQGIKEAVEEVKLHRQGKVKLQSARDFLNEL